jgi:CheY-like chemotaxis protein
LWSIAFVASGALFGFIFAIPRVVASADQSHGGPGSESSGAREDSKANGVGERRSRGSEINSNLVEISDWLTKIIVGVGLIELKQLPGFASKLATFIGPSIGVALPAGKQIAVGIMVYFTVLGFIAAYTLTRVYLALIFKQAEVRVIREELSVQLPSGRQIDVSELSSLQQDAIEDLRSQVAKLVDLAPTQSEEALASDAAGPKRTILWVDDKPEKNALMIDQLRALDVTVDTAKTTADALKLLGARNYDVVITDMYRREGGEVVQDAGLRLMRQIRQSYPRIRMMVLSRSSSFFAEATQEGAECVTSSPTRLMGALRKALGLR